jgi:hypothetical protein
LGLQSDAKANHFAIEQVFRISSSRAPILPGLPALTKKSAPSGKIWHREPELHG